MGAGGYTIQPGDSPASIARRIFDDERAAGMLYQYNTAFFSKDAFGNLVFTGKPGDVMNVKFNWQKGGFLDKELWDSMVAGSKSVMAGGTLSNPKFGSPLGVVGTAPAADLLTWDDALDELGAVQRMLNTPNPFESGLLNSPPPPPGVEFPVGYPAIPNAPGWVMTADGPQLGTDARSLFLRALNRPNLDVPDPMFGNIGLPPDYVAPANIPESETPTIQEQLQGAFNAAPPGMSFGLDLLTQAQMTLERPGVRQLMAVNLGTNTATPDTSQATPLSKRAMIEEAARWTSWSVREAASRGNRDLLPFMFSAEIAEELYARFGFSSVEEFFGSNEETGGIDYTEIEPGLWIRNDEIFYDTGTGGFGRSGYYSRRVSGISRGTRGSGGGHAQGQTFGLTTWSIGPGRR